jgi:hypothetical protein
MWTRRLFIGSLGFFGALAASGAAYVGVAKARAPRERLLIDPDGDHFIYVDGLVVKADRVR